MLLRVGVRLAVLSEVHLVLTVISLVHQRGLIVEIAWCLGRVTHLGLTRKLGMEFGLDLVVNRVLTEPRILANRIILLNIDRIQAYRRFVVAWVRLVERLGRESDKDHWVRSRKPRVSQNLSM